VEMVLKSCSDSHHQSLDPLERCRRAFFSLDSSLWWDTWDDV